MRNVRLTSLLVATAITTSTSLTHGSLVDTFHGIALGIHGFNESFYTPDMMPYEKEGIDAALKKISVSQRAYFMETFSNFAPYLHPTLAGSSLSALAHLSPDDWVPFKTFLKEVFDMSNQYLGNTKSSSTALPFCSTPLSRVINSLAYDTPPESRPELLTSLQSILNEMRTTQKPSTSTQQIETGSSLQADGLSWVIRGIASIPKGNYLYVQHHAKRMIPKEASLYNQGIMLEALSKVAPGSEEVFEYAEKYISPDLSYEHRSSIINTFARLSPDTRKQLAMYTDKISKGKDSNYRAWAIQALGTADNVAELNALYTFLSKNTYAYHDMWKTAIDWKAKLNRR